MIIRLPWRRLGLATLTGLVIAVGSLAVPPVLGGPTPAVAQLSDDFVFALEPYGRWVRHPRFGEVWVPADLPRDWRPYEYGHWVYTDEWGWYWVSDPEEEDWGWITFHYGRWAFERGLGWFWVPDDEWAPAWVDWRYGDGYAGWAPLPPDEYIEAYEAAPVYWVFVPVRYVTARRWRHYAVESRHRAAWLQRSHIVNRTFRAGGARLGVNPGLSPAFVAAQTHSALPAYRVRPRVLGRTQGVAGAVQLNRADLRAGNRVTAPTVQRTTTVIKPSTSTSAAPQPLNKGEHGRLGSHPPRAAQGVGAPQQQQQQQQQQQKAPLQPPPVQKQQQLQKQQVAPPPQRVAPPSPLPSGQRQERRNQHPPSVIAPAKPQAAPPPQVQSVRPIAPQTPPSPLKSGAQHPPPVVKQAPPPPTVKRVAPPPHPVPPTVKHAPPPKPVQAVKPPPPPTVKKQAAPAKPAANPAAKKKPDDKKKPDEIK
jgi:hypothetical protein